MAARPRAQLRQAVAGGGPAQRRRSRGLARPSPRGETRLLGPAAAAAAARDGRKALAGGRLAAAPRRGLFLRALAARRWPAARAPRGLDAEADRHFDHPDHRRGADHHRSGVRVRLFRHPGLQGPARRGLPHRPGQFQSGDDHDRPGHGRPHLYRADHAGDRRQDHRQGALRRPRRLRAAADHGRPDGAQLRAVAEEDGRARALRRRDDRRDRQGDRQGRGPRAVPRGDDPDRPRDAALASHQDAAAGARGARRHRPAGDHPPELHARAAPAAASPTTSTSSSRSSSAASTPRRPTRC